MKSVRIISFVLCVLLLTLSLASCDTKKEKAPQSDNVITGLAVDVEAVVQANTGKDISKFSKEELDFFEKAVNSKIQYTLDLGNNALTIFCGKNADGTLAEQHMLSYIAPHWVPWQNETPGVFNSEFVSVGESAVVKFDYEKAALQQVQTVYIEEGVGSVGRYSFAYAGALKEVYLPHSLQKIDRTAFYQCDKLETVYYAGNENDFNKVILDEVRNWNGIDTSGNNTIEENEVTSRLTDKIHFGESVTVLCKNEEGDTITRYTVGGYFSGDEYTLRPLELEGLTYVGSESEITGKFKKNDTTVHEFVYHCEHNYQQKHSSVACSSFCTKCGRADPNPAVAHSWSEPVVVSERGFLTPLNQSVICTKCNAKISEYKDPYGPLVMICVAAPILLAGIVFAIVTPIRKRKKLKDMTW